MTTHRHARVGINRGRHNWKAFYSIKDGRVIGEIWKISKLRDFNVKLGTDGRFNVDTCHGSGSKVTFEHVQLQKTTGRNGSAITKLEGYTRW